MKKKGFTSIELFVVIIILTVIALITTPLIMNKINDAKKKSLKNTADEIVNAMESKSKSARLDGNSTAFIVDLTGTDLDYKGSKPKKGYAAINVSGNIALEMNDGTWCVTKGFTDTDVTITKLEEGCDGSSIQNLDLSIPSSDGQTKGTVTGIIYSTSSSGAKTGGSISEKWCVVRIVNGKEEKSCDGKIPFYTEADCQKYRNMFTRSDPSLEEKSRCQKEPYSFVYKVNASDLNSDYYFKYDVQNDIIETSYLCYMADKEYCFNGAEKYSDHIQVLQSLEPWIKEHAGSCRINENNLRSVCELDEKDFAIITSSDGTVSILQNNNDSCKNHTPHGCSCTPVYTHFMISELRGSDIDSLDTPEYDCTSSQ